MAVAGALSDSKSNINTSYINGTSVGSLARTYGVSIQAIKEVLKQGGVYPRSASVLSAIYDRIKEPAIELRSFGLRVSVIANRLGVSSHLITKVLHGEKVLPKLKRGENSTQRRKIKPDQECDLITFYNNGATQLELAKKYNCTETVVHKALVRAGVALRSRGQVSPYRTDPNFIKQVLELWKQGQSITKISGALGVSPNPVSRALEEYGINNKHAKRDRHGRWKGGRIVHPVSGYIMIRVELGHPFASMRTVNGYVLEHRLVMAEHLGRSLLKHESVHHINGDHGDNQIENLQLRTGKHGHHVRYRCSDCGSYRVEPAEL